MSKPKKLKTPGAPDYKGTKIRIPKASKPKGEPRPKKVDPKNIYEALLYFQKESITLPRRGEGKTTSGKVYRYATLDDLIETIRPVFDRLSMGFTQIVSNDKLLTKIFHVRDGNTTEVSAETMLGKPVNMQDMGARITYARRYTLTSMLGISTEEDTDAVPTPEVPDKASTVETPLPSPTPSAEGAEEAENGSKIGQGSGSGEEGSATTSTPEKPRSEPYMRAQTAINSAYSVQALEVIKGQIERSSRLNDSERKELIEEVSKKVDEIEGTIR